MRAIILAGGYGTRLARDIEKDTSGEYQHLAGIPKPLLPIGQQPLISHWSTALDRLKSVHSIDVVTNLSNHVAFQEWAKKASTKVEMVCDASTSNETRSGAVACMNLAVQHFNIKDHVLIIAGDTLFYDDFILEEYISKFQDFLHTDAEASMLLYVTCTDEEVHKYGILETNEAGLVTGFLEKPQPQDTPSRKECPCFYFLNNKCLHLLSEFLDELKDQPLKSRDATGNFIAYLITRKPVYAVAISGRFDVGGLQSYEKCNKHFQKLS